MSKIRKAYTVLIVAVLLISSIGITAFYFNKIVNDRNTKISSLEFQIANQTTEIAGLNNQISNLKSEITNLTSQITNVTSANLTTSLKITEENGSSIEYIWGYVLHKIPYDYLAIEGSVNNIGKGTAYNAGLNVVAYDAQGTTEINMTVPLADGNFGTDAGTVFVVSNAYGSTSATMLGKLDAGQDASLSIKIFHEGVISNWKVIPVWTNSP